MNNLKDWALGIASRASKVKFNERQVGDVMILEVGGNIITGEGADNVRDIIRRLLAEGHRKILLNLEHVRWIDSTGLGELVAALTAVTREGGQIKLLKARGNIYELMAITGLHTVFAIYDDELQALNDYQ